MNSKYKILREVQPTTVYQRPVISEVSEEWGEQSWGAARDGGVAEGVPLSHGAFPTRTLHEIFMEHMYRKVHKP